MAVISESDYKEIVRLMESSSLRRESLQLAANQFPQVPEGSLMSIYSQLIQLHTKRTHHYHRRPDVMEQYYQSYLLAREQDDSASVLLELAHKVCLSPTLYARIILEQYAERTAPDNTATSAANTTSSIATTTATTASTTATTASSTASSAATTASSTTTTAATTASSTATTAATTASSTTTTAATTASSTTTTAATTASSTTTTAATTTSSTATTASSTAATTVTTSSTTASTTTTTAATTTSSTATTASSTAATTVTTSSTTASTTTTTAATTSSTTALVNQWIKNPFVIPDPTLQLHIKTCILHDTNYGPLADNIKRSIGYEYEFLLTEKVKEINIPFHDERGLRSRGYDKTPDVKLEVPVAVNGHVVNWIESKASFGDRNSHSKYLEEQFWSYQNRYGSGLVIYWFGFVSELNSFQDQGILLMERFPDSAQIVKLNTHMQ